MAEIKPTQADKDVALGEKDEKMGMDVAVVESQQTPQRSPRERVARFTNSIFTRKTFNDTGSVLWKFARFAGPGAVISVAYVDPDNLQSNVTAGAQFRFKLLFMILFSNVVAVFLQALSTKLGCVTGMDLAQMNRAFLPRWLNIGLWLMAEASIICTDISQVIGTAIAINLLNPKIPIIGGCAISVADTLFILFFYRPDGSLRKLRLFEIFVSIFVIGIFIMYCIELSYVSAPVRDVFRGYVPSREIFVSDGLYESCALLGGTLMPHTIYLGSGLVQARMRELDRIDGHLHEVKASDSKFAISLYRPTLSTIKACMSYTIAELCIVLFVVAVFVNSAVLIVAGAAFTPDASDADLPGLYQLFNDTIGNGTGTIFALSLLFSGVSAGIVATMAGQMICEGAMNWRMSPFLRRIVTRTVAIIPAMIIAAAEGQAGLAAALNGCNVVLSLALIFLTFPLIWFTSRHKYMTVRIDDSADPVGVVDGILSYNTERALWNEGHYSEGTISMANNWTTTIVGFVIWFIIAAMNVATLTFLGLGIGGGD
ncbi:natural resistance-associated macrophage protein [Hyaloscypha bicolor E]|uniref:Natural resistance-associated macrophage protein n=1 Tax=Hyaloscypha bicolor E TaxID=1095630 RepID=A0A2J6TLY7_9HELO|nr:natural resistance-associated macrophage protein [Hyaloscypha bicolor E]PMD64019.1 natural resistance-associated macrophage protein [Hyaloscypha bicolor E]